MIYIDLHLSLRCFVGQVEAGGDVFGGIPLRRGVRSAYEKCESQFVGTVLVHDKNSNLCQSRITFIICTTMQHEDLVVC